MKFIFIVILLIHAFFFLSAQKSVPPNFKRISSEYFTVGTPVSDSMLQIHSYHKLKFKYVRNFRTFKDFFLINGKKFRINELLVWERMEIYSGRHKKRNFILISSPDFSSSGKAYSVYRNYYIFFLDKHGKVLNFEKAIDSKLSQQRAFWKFWNDVFERK